MMFRSRDIVALLASLVLTRMAWNTDVLESVGASVHLSWYLPLQVTHANNNDKQSNIMTAPKLLDIDGDGTAEAVVVVRDDKVLQIFDLRRAAMQQWKAPFVPPSLLESEAVDDMPVAVNALTVATGHVVMQEDVNKQTVKKDIKEDKTRHYFCGNSWHDATKCQVHCPSGLSSDCPDGEICYADTPCDAMMSRDEIEQRQLLDAMFTPQGSLPAIATLWENGAVTLHGMAVSNTTKKLQLAMLWTTNLFANFTVIEWENEYLEFLDAKTAENAHGLFILMGSVDVGHRDEGAEPIHVSFVAALHAKTGAVLWESLSEDKTLYPEPELPLPLRDDSRSSIARRRSLKPRTGHRSHLDFDDNCMYFYRGSVLTSGVLPFLYWNPNYAQSKALHFDAQRAAAKGQQNTAQQQRKNSKKGSWFAGKHKMRDHNNQHRLHLGKPNVIASYNENGLQLRSLKNGRRLCHLSLWGETLYADLNHDGTVDSVNIITGQKRIHDDDGHTENRRWITELVGKVARVQGNQAAMKEIEEEVDKQAIVEAHLCHLNVLSGLPAKEQLFSANICGPTHMQDVEQGDYAMPSPPLTVEAIRGMGQDIVVAVNTGYVTRVQGTTGRRIWQVSGRHLKDFPTWEDYNVATLTRVESTVVVNHNRPILLVGENSFAIFSARHGRQLALSVFPQAVHAYKPLIADFNGDGTTDVICETDDALWGYSIHIQAGSSIVFRISIGLLLMRVMLALLRNRFGPQPGHRSTDA
jgi:hypothetical protein